ncbi:hypothetical protein [Actinoplanes sp. NPDC020271]|uniref:hypothetical protein n=1 Tax=Actinoplanes sp. NPDC020271 TaxID=3363896 RepID=UPI0037A8EE52
MRGSVSSRIWRKWMATVTAAEFTGFAVPATAGALTARSAAVVSVPVLLAAGAVEGLLLGWGQAVVLRGVFPGFPARRWTAVTSVAAMCAYAIGLLPSALAPVRQNWPVYVLVPGALLAGLALLNSIGAAQWTVLRGLTPYAGRWVVASALAWLAGLTVFLGFSMPLWHEGQALGVVIAVGVAGGFLMALTMAAVTGVVVRGWSRARALERVAR